MRFICGYLQPLKNKQKQTLVQNAWVQSNYNNDTKESCFSHPKMCPVLMAAMPASPVPGTESLPPEPSYGSRGHLTIYLTVESYGKQD